MPPTVSPLISIITVNFNDRAGLEKTILNVAAQSYRRKEHIIIDGGSTDGSPEIIQRYQSLLAHRVSEPDAGIYDAMNKGVVCACGDWVNFMNAGDGFHTDDVLEKIFSAPPPAADCIYGDTQIHYPGGFTRIARAGEMKTAWKRLPFVHQSAFVKTALARRHPFDLNFPLCADFNFFFNLYQQGGAFCRIGRVVADFHAGGVSDKKRIAAAREVWRAVRKFRRSPAVHFYFMRRIAAAFFKNLLRRSLPPATVRYFIRRKYTFPVP